MFPYDTNVYNKEKRLYSISAQVLNLHVLEGKRMPPVPDPVPVLSIQGVLQVSAVGRRTPRHLGFLPLEWVY